MHRVELKALISWNLGEILREFLMHRVELKDQAVLKIILQKVVAKDMPL